MTGRAGLDPADVTDDAFLGGALSILQPKSGYRAGVDAVLLAASVGATPGGARLLDVGAGVGTVGLSVARRLPAIAEVVLLERQPGLVALAEQNVHRNRLAGRVTVVAADIADQTAKFAGLGLGPDSFDQTLANPPFHAEGEGTPAADAGKAAAHAMPAPALTQWVRFLARVTRPGGSTTLIHKTEALAEVLTALDGRFGQLRILPIQAFSGEPAVRIIVQGRKGSRAPLRLLAPFVLHQADRTFTPAAEAILRRGAALPLT